LSYGRIVAELRLRIITEPNRFAQPRSPGKLSEKPEPSALTRPLRSKSGAVEIVASPTQQTCSLE